MSNAEIPAGAPCWIDLLTSDLEKAKDFYSQLFGWTYETRDPEKYGGYVMAYKDGKSAAGLMANDGQGGYPDVWTTYLRSENIEATAQASKDAGGQVLLDPMEVPEQGKMMVILDSAGAGVGVWEFGEHTGFQAYQEIGANNWNELLTKDYESALNFYRDVFAWPLTTMVDTPELRYSTFGAGESAKAGIMDATNYLPAEVPAHWNVCFAVENVDATIELAQSLGAKLTHPAEDSDYGRLAGITDPTGAHLTLMQVTA